MINPSFYNKKRLETRYMGSIQHYPIKQASVTLEWYEYTLKHNETIYKVAQNIFGVNLEYMWTIILDNNPPRHPDDWRQGDTIRLPKVIIRDSDTQ